MQSGQGPCSRGGSRAVLVTLGLLHPPGMYILLWSPFYRGGRSQSSEKSFPKVPSGNGRAGVQIFIFLLCPPDNPSLPPPAQGKAQGPFVLSCWLRLALPSPSLYVLQPHQTPPHYPIVPRACHSCMAKASGTHCFPCLSSCGRLLEASPC